LLLIKWAHKRFRRISFAIHIPIYSYSFNMADASAGKNGNCSTKDATFEYGANVHVSAHPVLSHKITILRSSTTRPEVFRAVLREVTYHLGYEATGKLTTKPVAISVPVGKSDHMDFDGHKLKERVAMIPILRSGLGMVDSMLELTPNAAIHHIGMYRVIGQNPVQYYNKLPKFCDVDVVYILDPVIATSATVMSVITLMKKVSTVLKCIRGKSVKYYCFYLLVF
jgi:uracil phosphoribosyltransferase